MGLWKKDGENLIYLATGWLKDNDKWYYFDKNGVMQRGWQSIDSKWYFLNKDGIMQAGWLQDNNKWYYLNPKGDMAIGWLTVNAKSYYLNKEGDLQLEPITIEGKIYKFDSNGAVIADNSAKTLEIPCLVTDKLIEFVKSYEGFSATPYRGVDSQNLTLGYGTTDSCSAKWLFNYVPVTKELATKALKEEIDEMAKKIKKDLDTKNIKLNQNEFDAICSFAYNCGTGALLGSTLYKKICQGIRDTSLENNFTAWSNCNGQRLQGLYNRRIEEYKMFISGDYERNL